MVSYDPNAAIYFKTTNDEVSSYHLQYFGIVARRAWVRSKLLLPMKSLEERSTKPPAGKSRKDYEVAMTEANEAFKLELKQRKLKFIFNFVSSIPGNNGSQGNQRKRKQPVSTNSSVVAMETQKIPRKINVENSTSPPTSPWKPTAVSSLEESPLGEKEHLSNSHLSTEALFATADKITGTTPPSSLCVPPTTRKSSESMLLDPPSTDDNSTFVSAHKSTINIVLFSNSLHFHSSSSSNYTTFVLSRMMTIMLSRELRLGRDSRLPPPLYHYQKTVTFFAGMAFAKIQRQ